MEGEQTLVGFAANHGVSCEHVRPTAFSPSGSLWARRGGVEFLFYVEHDAE